MILSPLIAERLPPPIQNSTMLMITVESLAAEMATLSYLLYTVGQMSAVGLLANTLIAVAITQCDGWFSWHLWRGRGWLGSLAG